MDKKSFFKQYFEIEANSSLPHAEDAYKDFDFDKGFDFDMMVNLSL